MKKIILLGATSNISKYLLQITLIDDDWNNLSDLREGIKDQDIVYMATGHILLIPIKMSLKL